MDKTSIIEITLGDQEKQKLTQELGMIEYDPSGGVQYIESLRKKIYMALPETLIATLTNQRGVDKLASAIVINNVPIDKIIYGSPDLEQTGKQFKSGTLSENMITAFASLVGEPYSIYFEGPELVNNLTPQTKTRFDYTGLGSEIELDFHIENAALQYLSEDDYSPSGLFLLGIRRDERIQPPQTFIADSRKALKLLSTSDLDILYNEYFYLNLPHRWREIYSNEQSRVKCSVIKGALDKPRVSVAFYSDMVVPITYAAQKALDNFHQAIKETSVGIQITPGKLVYVDNRFTLHARERFTPTYDDQGCPYRWIQRVFVSPSLWAFRNFQPKGGRVFFPNSNKGLYQNVSTSLTKVA